MQAVMDIISYIVNLGSYIFVPMLMCIIGLLFGLKFSKAIKAGATVGIGLVGVSIVSTLTSNSLGPVINEAIDVLNLNLTSIDVGGSPAAAVGFGGLIAATLIVLIILVNIILVALKLTNTVNVDIYNFWYFAITAGFVNLLTGNFWLGILAGVTHAILGLKVADIMAHRTQEIIGIEAISIPHGFAAASAPLFLVLDKIYDYIPFLKHRKFADRELYIGLDSAVTIGHPVTISVGFLMIPVFLIVAAILPGNTTLPLGELPFAAFYVCFATIVHRANKRRTIISSLIFIPIVLWISSWAAPLFTQLASNAGLELVADGQQATTMALGNLFILIPTLLAQIPVLGAIILIVIDVLVIFGGKKLEKYYAKKDAEFEEEIGTESA